MSELYTYEEYNQTLHNLAVDVCETEKKEFPGLWSKSNERDLQELKEAEFPVQTLVFLLLREIRAMDG